VSGRDLFSDPVWRAEELGLAIPDAPHAISVALPRWQDVVGYEEKRPEVVDTLKSGYPRFVIHERVQALAVRLAAGESCLPFPSRAVARACVAFARQQSDQPFRVVEGEGVSAVATSEAGFLAMKAFWQWGGQIVSSRRAESLLAGRAEREDADTIRASLRRRLARLYDCEPDDVFLQPTGMAAVHAALKALLARAPGRPTVQLGFPYADTLRLQNKLGHGATLLNDLNRAPDNLRVLLKRGAWAGCFTEIPGNPLLGTADLRRVTPVLREFGVPLVADDVVATPFNVDLGAHADLIATSLTKYLAGTGDVMGGALIVNPRSPYYGELKRASVSLHEELLWGEDAAVLEANIGAFSERMRRHNENGLFVAERLRRHPAVAEVWYPKWVSHSAYDALRRPEGGWGSLVSFLPKKAAVSSPGIFDRLALCKGPSLGTVFTLACPFTLLAHFNELEWAESCGVPRHLIRLSVGLEEPAEIWERLERALSG